MVKTHQKAETLLLESPLTNTGLILLCLILTNYKASKRDLHLHLTEATHLELYHAKQRIFEQGHRNSRLLAMSHHDTPLTLIPEFICSTGELISSPEDILKDFKRFYQMLYTTTLPSDVGLDYLAPLLDPLALGWLLDSEISSNKSHHC